MPSGIKLSNHALEQMEARGIAYFHVMDTIEEPDSILEESANERVYQKLIMFENQKSYLIRVIVNPALSPNLVLTVYRTSKINKYL